MDEVNDTGWSNIMHYVVLVCEQYANLRTILHILSICDVLLNLQMLNCAETMDQISPDCVVSESFILLANNNTFFVTLPILESY